MYLHRDKSGCWMVRDRETGCDFGGGSWDMIDALLWAN